MTHRRKTAILAMIAAMRQIIREHEVTPDEYDVAVRWLSEAGRQDCLAGVLEHLLAPAVAEVGSTLDATPPNPEGPYYLPDSPALNSPCSLPSVELQAGRPLVLTGRVRSTTGSEVPRSVLDLWQADGDGRYSNIHPEVPPFALRGRVTTDAQGCFAVRTVLPGAYPLSDAGLVLELVGALGRTAYRPAHIHVKIDHPGYRPLTTQVYFPDDPYDETELLGERTSTLLALTSDDGEMLRADIELVLDPLPTGSCPASWL